MRPPERSPERDAAIEALLPWVSMDGWTLPALVRAAGPDTDLLFPGGAADLVEAYIDLADRWMMEDAAAIPMDGLGLPGRVRAVLAARFERNAPYKAAVQRGMGVLAMPGNAVLAARTAARTVNAIWYAAGDKSADFSWYTKRAVLAGVYGTTLLYWLRDESENDTATLAFLDRRLHGIGRLGRVRRWMRRARAGA